jgi:hypothetical protein
MHGTGKHIHPVQFLRSWWPFLAVTAARLNAEQFVGDVVDAATRPFQDDADLG